VSGWLVVVAAILIIAVPFDVYVAFRFVAEAARKPYLPVLTLAALRSLGIAIAATAFGVLGTGVIYLVVVGDRLIPPGVAAALISIGAIVVSLPNVYALRLLREGKVES
jgi:hypothetical protein